MRSLIVSALLAAGLLMATGARAQTQPQVTATCKDGTTFTGASKRGACRHHGGVQAWATATTAKAAAPATTTPARPAATAAAASGGHAGQVWVNTGSKVYHCAGDRWYGKTKHGEYLTEAAAKAAGYHPAQGKACTH